MYLLFPHPKTLANPKIIKKVVVIAPPPPPKKNVNNLAYGPIYSINIDYNKKNNNIC